MPDAWPARRWWEIPFAATRFWWCTVGWWQRCAVGAVVSLWLVPSLLHIGVGDYWRAFQDVVVCLILTALFLTADLDRRMARSMAGELHHVTRMLWQIMLVAPDIVQEGSCTSCSTEISDDALAVQCRAGHVVHIACLTREYPEVRPRCPLCLTKKEPSDADE